MGTMPYPKGYVGIVKHVDYQKHAGPLWIVY